MTDIFMTDEHLIEAMAGAIWECADDEVGWAAIVALAKTRRREAAAALAAYRKAAAAIERLRESSAENTPQITHAEGCWQWGRGRYECAMEEINRLRERAEKSDAIWQENLQAAWAALQMVREAIETLGGVGALPSEDAVLGLRGPLPCHEAGVLVEAVKAITARAEKAERERDALAEAIKPFLYLKNPDPDEDGDPLEGLPDGHGFTVVWDFESEVGSCQFTAGQIRRARAAIRAMRSDTP